MPRLHATQYDSRRAAFDKLEFRQQRPQRPPPHPFQSEVGRRPERRSNTYAGMLPERQVVDRPQSDRPTRVSEEGLPPIAYAPTHQAHRPSIGPRPKADAARVVT